MLMMNRGCVQGPIANLEDHLASPGVNNGDHGYPLPAFPYVWSRLLAWTAACAKYTVWAQF